MLVLPSLPSGARDLRAAFSSNGIAIVLHDRHLATSRPVIGQEVSNDRDRGRSV